MDDDKDFIYKLLEEVDFVVIPEEFISAACIREFSGEEYIIPYDQIDEMLDSGEFEDDEIESIEAIINLPMVRKRIQEITENILHEVFYL